MGCTLLKGVSEGPRRWGHTDASPLLLPAPPLLLLRRLLLLLAPSTPLLLLLLLLRAAALRLLPLPAVQEPRLLPAAAPPARRAGEPAGRQAPLGGRLPLRLEGVGVGDAAAKLLLLLDAALGVALARDDALLRKKRGRGRARRILGTPAACKSDARERSLADAARSKNPASPPKRGRALANAGPRRPAPQAGRTPPPARGAPSGPEAHPLAEAARDGGALPAGVLDKRLRLADLRRKGGGRAARCQAPQERACGAWPERQAGERAPTNPDTPNAHIGTLNPTHT
jgi:hypothetical protein